MESPKRKTTPAQWVIRVLIVVIFAIAMLIGVMRLMELNQLQKEKEDLEKEKAELEEQLAEAE